MNKLSSETSFVTISEKELLVRLEFLKKNDTAKAEEFKLLIAELFTGDANLRDKTYEIEIELHHYYKFFVGDKVGASLLLRKKENFNNIYLNVKNLINDNLIQTLFVPFSSGKNISIIKRGMTKELVWRILENGYQNDESNFL